MHDRSSSKRFEKLKNRYPFNYRCILDNSYFNNEKPYILKPCLHWSFNLFTLDRLTAGFPLLYLTTFLFEKTKFFKKFELDYFEMQRAFKQIEDLYHENNAYHNALHATDVVQATYCLLKELRVKRVISSFDFMCSIIAAICHDIDHPGVNQSFLIKSKQMLSLFYKSSLLENHHANVSIAVFTHTNIFKRFTSRRWKLFTDNVRNIILATDITRQPEFLNQITVLTEKRAKDPEYDLTTEDVILIQQIAIKCADISNPCRAWDVCLVWADSIMEEFFRQGDREKKLSLHVLPTMDRTTTTKAKVQIGFIKFLVLPLFEKWNAYIGNGFTAALVERCAKNLQNWVIEELNEKVEARVLEDDDDDDTDSQNVIKLNAMKISKDH